MTRALLRVGPVELPRVGFVVAAVSSVVGVPYAVHAACMPLIAFAIASSIVAVNVSPTA